MNREDMSDLVVFLAVARAGSFTRAAHRLGMSQSGVSQVVQRLEDRVELRLLERTTRSVSLTAAGEHLLAKIGPLLDTAGVELSALSALRDRVAGVIRVTAVEHAAKTILCPAIAPLLKTHPEIQVEIAIDYGLSDIVSDHFDAGVRLGEHVAKDMVAVRLSPDVPMAIIGSPEYFAEHPAPRDPGDLIHHRCINLRLPTSGTVNRWRFIQRGVERRVHVEGPLVLNTIELILDAALHGVGLAYLPLDQVQAHLTSGRLVSVLGPLLPPLPGYYLYYPSRRNASPAFQLFVDAVRLKVKGSG